MAIKIRPEQVRAIRQPAVAAGLQEYFNEVGQPAEYDSNAGQVLVSDPLGHRTRYSFGQSGLIEGMVTPLGRRFGIDVTSNGDLRRLTNPAGYVTELEYNARGNVKALHRGGREAFQLQYDGRNRVASILHYDRTLTRLNYHKGTHVSAVTNRLGYTERVDYDPAGRVTSIADGRGQRTTFAYRDGTAPSGMTFPDGRQQNYDFDSDKRLTRISEAGETLAEISYDPNGNSQQIRHGNGERCRFAYDPEGRTTAAINGTIEVEYEYDENGRVRRERQGDASILCAYDIAGNLIELTYPSGSTVRFAYDADRRLASIVDWNGSKHRFEYKPGEAGYKQSSTDDLVIDVAESVTGLPIAYAVRGKDDALFSQAFEYDFEGRLIAVVDSQFGRREFQYDAEGQLTAAGVSRDAMPEDFKYDGAGNRVSASGRTSEYNQLNQLVNFDGESWRYDNRGNMLTCPGRGGSWRLSYDDRNQLAQAVGPHGETISFAYDAFGRRVRKEIIQQHGQVTETRYVWAGEHLIGETTCQNGRSTTQEFLYRPGGYTPFATRIDGTVYLYHCDHLGVPTRVTDCSGRIVWAAALSAFGVLHATTELITNPLRFPGHYHDRETGLHYNRFRYYSPQLGRYLSRDPVGVIGGFNLYLYSNNNPVNFSDPLGLWWKAALSVAAGVAVAAAVVLTAPVSVPALLIAAGAATLGVGVAVGVNKVLNLKEFCFPCGVKAFAEGFLTGAAFAAAIVAACIVFPAAAPVIAAGAAAVAIYSMLQEHFGWHLFPWENGSKPYSEMSVKEQNESLSGLAGNFVGAAAVGAVARVAMRGDRFSHLREPESLQDQMTLEAAKSGQGEVVIENLGDPKYKGMQKMQLVTKSADGKISTVHYVRDPKTGELMDFKFTRRSNDTPGKWATTPDPKVDPGTPSSGSKE